MSMSTPASAALPVRPPFMSIFWNDDQTPARGFVVIDQLITGIATGGTRMRPGCSLDEVADLAREMTLKMGAYGIHVGGAKGGIDFDPADPDAAGVRKRFLQAVRPLLESYWVTAGDLGTQQADLDRTFDEIGLGPTSFHAAMVRSPEEASARSRVDKAFGMRMDGLSLSELIGGFGVAEAALAGLEQLAIPVETASVVVQGFGTMGGATALYLSKAGARIVGITDAKGLILNFERGLDVESMLLARSPEGVIDRTVLRKDDQEGAGNAWLSQDVDVLIPAAVSYSITVDNCDAIHARLIVEAANVPTTPAAELLLWNRGIQVVPDFIANTGAAAGAWWVILGEATTPQEVCRRLTFQVRSLVTQLMIEAADESTSIRSAAIDLAARNADILGDEFGRAVPLRELFSQTHAGPTRPFADERS